MQNACVLSACLVRTELASLGTFEISFLYLIADIFRRACTTAIFNFLVSQSIFLEFYELIRVRPVPEVKLFGIVTAAHDSDNSHDVCLSSHPVKTSQSIALANRTRFYPPAQYCIINTSNVFTLRFRPFGTLHFKNVHSVTLQLNPHPLRLPMGEMGARWGCT